MHIFFVAIRTFCTNRVEKNNLLNALTRGLLYRIHSNHVIATIYVSYENVHTSFLAHNVDEVEEDEQR